MTDERFAIALKIKQAMDRAEADHPTSRSVRALHGQLTRLLFDHRDDLSDEQFVALGGGTGKTPPDDDD